jgi:hypothetical protein
MNRRTFLAVLGALVALPFFRPRLRRHSAHCDMTEDGRLAVAVDQFAPMRLCGRRMSEVLQKEPPPRGYADWSRWMAKGSVLR